MRVDGKFFQSHEGNEEGQIQSLGGISSGSSKGELTGPGALLWVWQITD